MPVELAALAAVTKRFGHFEACRDVSFSVAAGEVVGLLGANGAGKTTALRILLGLLAPSEGQARLMAGSPDRARRRRVGYVPQGLGLYTDLTVEENVEFVAHAYGAPVPHLPAELAAVGHRLVGQLPLGLQRQAAFTCALLHRPELLVLDEPTSGVDPVARAELWDTIHEQSAGGVGVLVTTHHLQEAQQCDRLLLMAAGEIVARGSEADVVGDTHAMAVDTAQWQEAFTALDDAGMPVMLDGRLVRVADRPVRDILEILDRAGITATAQEVPATIAERMVVLAMAHADR